MNHTCRKRTGLTQITAAQTQFTIGRLFSKPCTAEQTLDFLFYSSDMVAGSWPNPQPREDLNPFILTSLGVVRNIWNPKTPWCTAWWIFHYKLPRLFCWFFTCIFTNVIVWDLMIFSCKKTFKICSAKI